MRENVNVNLIQCNKLEMLKKQVFDVLDVSEDTRKEYGVRIKHFMKFTEMYGINC